MKRHRQGNKSTVREVDAFAAYLAILDLIDNEMPRIGTLGELRTLLVLWRKTHAWGRLSEEVGTTELQRRTGLDRGTVRRSVQKIAVGGVITVTAAQVELDSGSVVHGRKRFTWHINSRVEAALAKAAECKQKRRGRVDASCTYPLVNDAPTGCVNGAPTQSEVDLEGNNYNPINKHTSDYLPTNRTGFISRANIQPNEASEFKPEITMWTEADRSLVTQSLKTYMEGDDPSPHLVASTLDAGGGATAEEICHFLNLLWHKRLRPGTKNGPRKWGWFPVVVRRHFDDERVQLSEQQSKNIGMTHNDADDCTCSGHGIDAVSKFQPTTLSATSSD